MQEHTTHASSGDSTGSTLVSDLVFENKTIHALIKGLEEDIKIFQAANEGKGSPDDIVRFTMQLNILKEKEKRNLAAINELIKEQHGR